MINEPKYITPKPDSWSKIDDEFNKFTRKEQEYILNELVKRFILSD